MKYLFLLIFFLCTFSCSENTDTTPSPQNSSTQVGLVVKIPVSKTHSINFDTDTLSYLALGDSYTIGSGVSMEQRWPNQLKEYLRVQKNIKLSDAKIIATSGWTTNNLLTTLDKERLNTKYDMVSLLIGVNNQYQGGYFPTFQKEFIDLLEICFEKANSKSGIFVLSIPDYGFTPFGAGNQAAITAEIDEYNTWIKKVCEVNKVKYYDITTISRVAKDDLTLLAADQLHPSGKMYALWIKKISEDLPDLFIQ